MKLTWKNLFTVFGLPYVALALLHVYAPNGIIHAQDKPKDPPKTEQAPAMTLENKEKFEALEKKSLQIYIRMQQIQKQYEDQLNANPEYSDLVKKNQDLQKEIGDATNEAMKDIDKTKWQINYDDVNYVPVTQQTPAQAQAPAPPTITAPEPKK
jgi:hypothetical protein